MGAAADSLGSKRDPPISGAHPSSLSGCVCILAGEGRGGGVWHFQGSLCLCLPLVVIAFQVPNLIHAPIHLFFFFNFLIGEGNGNPLQFSFLRNPMDTGAWQATVPRVTQCRTQLKRLGTHTFI